MTQLVPTSEVELGGKTRHLRLDMKALRLIKERTGENLLERYFGPIMRSAVAQKAEGEEDDEKILERARDDIDPMKMLDPEYFTATVHSCLHSDPDAPTYEDVETWLHVGHFLEISLAVASLIGRSMTPPGEGKDEADEPAPEAETETAPTGA